MVGGVLVQGALAGSGTDSLQFLGRQCEGSFDVVRAGCDQDLSTWLKEGIQSLPRVADDRRTAPGSFE